MIIVLDFGGQYKELIARQIRKLCVYSLILPSSTNSDEIRKLNPDGIILTGGPSSVYESKSCDFDTEIFKLNIPILGICYGMQLLAKSFGGNVTQGNTGEYGIVVVNQLKQSLLLLGIPNKIKVLMSHRDIVSTPPPDFNITAKTGNYISAFEHIEKKIYGVQYHPETSHTEFGTNLIENFLFKICDTKPTYQIDSIINEIINDIRNTVKDKHVLLALSGGVDSSVVAMLLSKAIPNQLVCVFVDHGFMRLNEANEIEEIFSKQNLRFVRINAKDRFLNKIKNISDPEIKRKKIGEEFIRVFEEEAKKLGNFDFLAQGTIYPDIVESGNKNTATIKSHHNVGGLPENVSFKAIIEPLKTLFKDEVKEIGKKLGLADYLNNRQPFPGPGLAIRIIGEVTEEKLTILQKSDAILREEIDKLKTKPSQYFAVLTDTLSVGVKGDKRTYDNVIALRAVTTDDFMTCTYTPLNHRLLAKISTRITNEVKNVSRVVYDITSKPPGTIEWE